MEAAEKIKRADPRVLEHARVKNEDRRVLARARGCRLHPDRARQIMRMIVCRQVDTKSGRPALYALQIASAPAPHSL
jgi:hypothetical protein